MKQQRIHEEFIKMRHEMKYNSALCQKQQWIYSIPYDASNPGILQCS